MQRRNFVKTAATLALGAPMGYSWAAATPANVITRPIPSSGEMLPVVGMGSSRTFDLKLSEENLANLVNVMQHFYAGGGALVDSSPMYGAAEAALGEVISRIGGSPKTFAATKVWTDGREAGIAQMQESSRLMRMPVLDLIQIHNLRDWKVHLPTLRQFKQEGRIRYLGITTSHQRDHEELEAIMRNEQLDFVQFSYNIDNRLAEQRLLPLAAERGIATLINRPFLRGQLFKRIKGQALPALATELGCQSWGQFFLKFIIGHPAVTCLIPATAKVHHMIDNMGANRGEVPDEATRQQMLRIYNAL